MILRQSTLGAFSKTLPSRRKWIATDQSVKEAETNRRTQLLNASFRDKSNFLEVLPCVNPSPCSSVVSFQVAAAAEVIPITPAEAAKKINEKVLVEMEVKSTGGKENHYLNSEEDFKDAKNFTIFISKDLLEKFKKAGIESPSMHYKDKKIQVSGTVVLEKEKPWIKVEDPDQIKIIAKEKK